MDRIQEWLNGMDINISQCQKEMLGYILLTMERERKDGTASELTPLYFIPRHTAIRRYLKQQAALTALTLHSGTSIAIMSNQDPESTWRLVKHWAKKNNLMRPVGLNGDF